MRNTKIKEDQWEAREAPPLQGPREQENWTGQWMGSEYHAQVPVPAGGNPMGYIGIMVTMGKEVQEPFLI